MATHWNLVGAGPCVSPASAQFFPLFPGRSGRVGR